MIEQRTNELTVNGTLSAARLLEMYGSLPKHELERELMAARQADGRRNRPSIYLSHCAGDHDILTHLVYAMRRVCPDLYVDWSDPDVSPLANDTTVRVVLGRIRAARRFIWLASAATTQSTRRHWELGVAAGTKQLGEISIVFFDEAKEGTPPISDRRVHPHILEETRYGLPTGKLLVAYADGMRIPLRDWLTP